LEEAVILYMGHDGLFRSGELLSGFTVEDLVWSLDHSQFTVVLDRSKVNRRGDGESVTICDYEGRSAVKLMIQWFCIMKLWDRPGAHIFPSRRGKGWLWDRTLSTDWLRDVIKKGVASIGLDPVKFSGHSLRAGGATDLFVARVPYFLIKKMGRWESDAAMLYYRCEEDVTDAVAAAFGKVSAQAGGGAH
jgi:integrase